MRKKSPKKILDKFCKHIKSSTHNTKNKIIKKTKSL